MVNLTVLYFNYAPARLVQLIRGEAPPDLNVQFPERDEDRERSKKIALADAVIVATQALEPRFIEAAPRLRLVQHQEMHYADTVPVEVLRERGIRLALTPTSAMTGVAEYAVLLALAACRQLAYADAELRRGQWRSQALRPDAWELNGSVIGYIGMGKVGQAAAARFQAFNTRGLYYDPQVRLSPEREAILDLTRAEQLDDLLQEADIVTLHVAPDEHTRRIINARALAQMKPGAILVNTADGSLVDQAALVQALTGGHLGGAGLDVFASEPLPPASPLLRLPNVVLTPHIGAATRDALQHKMQAAFTNIRRFFAGHPLTHEVPL